MSAPAGACAPPLTVPAGRVKVQETGDASENVSQITALNSAGVDVTLGPDAGPAADLPTATVVAGVAAGDASKQTIVTMTNNSARLKLCKYLDAGRRPGDVHLRAQRDRQLGPNHRPRLGQPHRNVVEQLARERGLHRGRPAPGRDERLDQRGDRSGQQSRKHHGRPDDRRLLGRTSDRRRIARSAESLGQGHRWCRRDRRHVRGRRCRPGLLKLCKLASLGTVTEFTSGLNPGSSPAALTGGPGGNVWFADQGTTKAIGEITPSGVITEFSLPATSKPADIEEGPDGNLWFTDQGTTRAIGRMTPTGVVTEFSAGLNAGSLPNGLTVGPDGNLWFADRGTTKAIGRITTSGAITEFPCRQRPHRVGSSTARTGTCGSPTPVHRARSRG